MIRERRFGLDDLVSLIVITVVFTAFLFSGYTLVTGINKSNETHTALCVFKYDIIKRRDAIADLLKEHPAQPEVIGLPRDVLIQTQASYTETIASLRLLSCPQDTASINEPRG